MTYYNNANYNTHTFLVTAWYDVPPVPLLLLPPEIDTSDLPPFSGNFSISSGWLDFHLDGVHLSLKLHNVLNYFKKINKKTNKQYFDRWREHRIWGRENGIMITLCATQFKEMLQLRLWHLRKNIWNQSTIIEVRKETISTMKY